MSAEDGELDILAKALARRTLKEETTLEEFERIVALQAKIGALRRQQDEKETIRYERRLGVLRESSRIVGGIIGVGLTIYLIRFAPTPAMIIGAVSLVVGFWNYSPQEVAALIEAIAKPRENKSSQSQISDSTKQSDS